jgi:hypothetical protein
LKIIFGYASLFTPINFRRSKWKIFNKRGMENPLPAVSKIDRLQQRAQRLQQEAQQARERVREESGTSGEAERDSRSVSVSRRKCVSSAQSPV